MENYIQYDELTDLLNRKEYNEIQNQLNEHNLPIVYELIDIDHYHEYVEEYGCVCGEALLKKTANALSTIIGNENYVFRAGGDRFILLICSIEGEVTEYIKKIFIEITTILFFADQGIPAAHLSVGAFVSKNGVSHKCYQIADAALSRSKQTGYAGCTIMDENKNVVFEYHDQTMLSINMSKQKLQHSVRTGSWRIEIPEDALPRMYADETMLQLIGIEKNVTPEECYASWFSGIDEEYMSVVLQTVDTIFEGRQAEVSYKWNHPTLGTRIVRCGGICDNEMQNLKVMYGFHQDITEITVVRKGDDLRYMMSALNEFLICNIYIDINTKSYTMTKPFENITDTDKYKGKIDQLVTLFLDDYVSSENQEEMRKFLQFDELESRISNHIQVSCDYINKGSNEWQSARMLPLRYNSSGRLQSMMIVVSSIDAEKKLKLQQEKQLLAIRTAYKKMFSKTQTFLGIIDLKKHLVTRIDTDYNDSIVQDELPYQYDTIVEYAAERTIVPSEKQKFIEACAIEKIIDNLKHTYEYVFRINRINPDKTTGLFAYHFCYYDDKKESIVCMIEEVTAREEYDPITEEVNMEGFMRKASYILHNEDGEYVMLHFDVKAFKAVNAQVGFDRGNMMLKEICDSIKESALEPIAITRSSSDHYYCLVLKKNLNYAEIIRLCKQNFVMENAIVPISMQCGIYEIEDKDMTIRAMCDCARLAETALNSENTGCPYYMFTEKLNKKYLLQKDILLSLDEAVEKEEFCNYLQPVYDAKTKEIVSAEALVRWVKSDGQIIPPDVFIPTLEDNGQISMVDSFICKRISSFQHMRYVKKKKIVPISVNLSRMDLYNKEFLDKIIDSVKASKIPCNYIRFEITESAYTEIPEHALQVMRMLREYGAKLLIDDFGKGYSSLSTLTEQFFDIVKLDMSFIRKIGKNTRAEAVITSTIGMAHKMNAKVIAEGVETQEQYEFLRDMDCDYIQGYYFSKPLPQNEFEEMLSIY